MTNQSLRDLFRMVGEGKGLPTALFDQLGPKFADTINAQSLAATGKKFRDLDVPQQRAIMQAFGQILEESQQGQEASPPKSKALPTKDAIRMAARGELPAHLVFAQLPGELGKQVQAYCLAKHGKEFSTLAEEQQRLILGAVADVLEGKAATPTKSKIPWINELFSMLDAGDATGKERLLEALELTQKGKFEPALGNVDAAVAEARKLAATEALAKALIVRGFLLERCLQQPEQAQAALNESLGLAKANQWPALVQLIDPQLQRVSAAIARSAGKIDPDSSMMCRFEIFMTVQGLPAEKRATTWAALGQCECGRLTGMIVDEEDRLLATDSQGVACSECAKPISFQWWKPIGEDGNMLPF